MGEPLRLHHSMVRMLACHANNRSSILLGGARKKSKMNNIIEQMIKYLAITLVGTGILWALTKLPESTQETMMYYVLMQYN